MSNQLAEQLELFEPSAASFASRYRTLELEYSIMNTAVHEMRRDHIRKDNEIELLQQAEQDALDINEKLLAEIERLRAENQRVVHHNADLANLAERLRERCYPDEVVMIGGTGHYVNKKVKAEIERLRAENKALTDDLFWASNDE